jgi:glycosyltransferase involved in cell wall biosynthesis
VSPTPVFSIIIPLHNKGQYVAETLASVQAQTFTDWEIIVIENHSTDNGPALVELTAADDSCIRLLRAPDSVRGPSAARNLGLTEAQGKWILFLDADDLVNSRYLEKMYLRQSVTPEADIVASPWVEFRDGEPPLEGVVKYPAGYLNNGLSAEAFGIAFTCWAVHAAIIRRSWLTERIWPEELDGYLAEDTAFWFRVVCGAKIAYSDFPGALYRTHTENCRTNYSARTWYEGTHRAALCNLEYLKTQCQSPSSAQLETLLRHYESLYEMAFREGEQEVAELALEFAKHWLSTLASSQFIGFGTMSLRHLLGIPSFCKLRSLILTLRGNQIV